MFTICRLTRVGVGVLGCICRPWYAMVSVLWVLMVKLYDVGPYIELLSFLLRGRALCLVDDVCPGLVWARLPSNT